MEVTKTKHEEPNILGLELWLASQILTKHGCICPTNPTSIKTMGALWPLFFYFSISYKIEWVDRYTFKKIVLEWRYLEMIAYLKWDRQQLRLRDHWNLCMALNHQPHVCFVYILFLSLLQNFRYVLVVIPYYCQVFVDL